MAKKVSTRMKHVNDLGTPRNSLDLPAKTFQTICVEGDNYMCHMSSNWSEKPNVNEGSIRKLIGEKTSKKSMTQHNTPTVVARLMGVDMLPSGAKPVAQKVGQKHEAHNINLAADNLSKNDSVELFSYPSKPTRHKRFFSVDSFEGHIPNQWSCYRAESNYKPREHPQEEELQKFKKEFEAWQVARVKECSEVVELGKPPSQWLAQKHINKEKMVHCANSIRMVKNVRPIGHEGDSVKPTSCERGVLQNKGMKGEYSVSWGNDLFHLRKRDQNSNSKLFFLPNSDQEADSCLAPSQIVILRPGLDKTSTCMESCLNSPCTSLERGNMEDFLMEVKERLNCEMLGKAYRKSTSVRGGGIETPYREKLSDPKIIAKHIATQVRESVTGNLGMNLFRSESTTFYGNEQLLKEANAPEYVSRDARRFLLQKLRNVKEKQTHQHVPLVHGSTTSFMLNNLRRKTQKSREIFNQMNKVHYLDITEDGSDVHGRSFQREVIHKGEIHEESSLENLTRSLSAPVSGTAFAKLLLEDRHRLTGAHIRRKHEEIEKITGHDNKQKREKFNLKEKITSLKNDFMRKGRLFGRKAQSFEHDNEHHSMKDCCSPMLMSFYDRPENPTEVPPSPASMCISVHDESCQPSECLSPPSSVSDVASPEDSMTPNVFKEISSNLKELRRRLNQLGTDGSDDAMLDEPPSEADLADIEDQDEAYIRELLLVSGLYDGSWDKSFSRWDSLGKLISLQVFDKVEESCRKKINLDEGFIKDQDEKSSHKMLFDLVNETLPTTLGSHLYASKFMRNTTMPLVQPLHGKQLLDQIWQIIRVYIHPPTDRSHFSLDGLVARDLQSPPPPWLRLGDDCNAIGKAIECQIFENLTDEIVKDFLARRSSS